MNRFTHEGRFVLDAADKPWPVNQWHENPLPAGIEADKSAKGCKYWLVQAPLPPVPADKLKTQDDMDLEAFEEWIKRDAFQIDRNGMEYSYAINAFRTACNYARQKP